MGDDYFAWGSFCAEVESGHGEDGRSIFWSFFGEYNFFLNFFLPIGLIGGSGVLLRYVVRWYVEYDASHFLF